MKTRPASGRQHTNMTMLRSFLVAICVFALASPPAMAREWKAGAAKVDITPRQSLWMAGYAARKRSSEGTLAPLYAKALALQDESGKRAVLVTSDLLGFPRALSQKVAERVRRQNGLARDRLLFNSSHTHCGPVVDHTLSVAYDLNDEQWAAIAAYTQELEDKVVAVIGEALGNMQPARVRFGHTEAGFTANRRLSFNPNGPVDRDVPFLRVEDRRGGLRAVVFGYACHNTTIGAEYCEFNGDYAGFAQAEIEKRHPGAMALFVEDCGADANPKPRGSVDLARQHGEELAAAVDGALGHALEPVRGAIRSAFEETPVQLATPPTRDELQARLGDKNVYVQRHARLLLSRLERDGSLPATYPYPIEVWQFGRDLTLVALGGEVVVDYELRLKKELGAEKLWVAGYSNDVFAYIPSVRVLKEGGYEGGGAMIYYGQPGPFAPSVEETIVGKVHELVDRCRRK